MRLWEEVTPFEKLAIFGIQQLDFKGVFCHLQMKSSFLGDSKKSAQHMPKSERKIDDF